MGTARLPEALRPSPTARHRALVEHDTLVRSSLVLAAGKDWALQLSPFHRSATAEEWKPFAAQRSQPDPPTSRDRTDLAAEGGAATVVEGAVPPPEPTEVTETGRTRRSTARLTGVVSRPPVLVHPTAVQAVGEVQETESSSVSLLGSGVGSRCQVEVEAAAETTVGVPLAAGWAAASDPAASIPPEAAARAATTAPARLTAPAMFAPFGCVGDCLPH